MIRIKPKDEVVAPVDTDGTTLHKSSCPSGGTVEVFLEPMKATRRLIVLGSSPIARTLVAIARTIGYRTIVGASDANVQDMEAADEVCPDFATAASQAGPNDALVLSTQGQRDREALRAALASSAGYIGMVASRHKFQTLIQDLAHDPQLGARIADIHAPAGLDIKAVEPEEIALSIISQIVALRRSRQIEDAAGNSVERAVESTG